MQISADIPSAKKYCAQLNWCSTTLKSEWKINNKKRHYSHNAVQLNSISIKHSARRKFSMYRYWANVTTVQIAIYIYIYLDGWFWVEKKIICEYAGLGRQWLVVAMLMARNSLTTFIDAWQARLIWNVCIELSVSKPQLNFSSLVMVAMWRHAAKVMQEWLQIIHCIFRLC